MVDASRPKRRQNDKDIPILGEARKKEYSHNNTCGSLYISNEITL